MIPQQPAADEIVLRAACLRIVTLHAMRLLPHLPQFLAARQLPPQQFAAFRARVAAEHDALRIQLQDIGLWPALTSDEQRFLETLPFDLEPPQVVSALFEREAASVLLWAAGLLDTLPDYGTASDPNWLALVERPPTTISPRPPNEMARALQNAERWHWRSRTQQLIDAGSNLPLDSGYSSWDALVRHAAEAAVRDGLLAGTVDGDFPVAGRPYRALSAAERETLGQTTFARHRALSWVCGHAPGHQWEHTPTPT